MELFFMAVSVRYKEESGLESNFFWDVMLCNAVVDGHFKEPCLHINF
jgi:hypothetical protein